jgi:3-methylfumaryl-CoA hydratase
LDDTLDINFLRQWIGAEEQAEDVVSPGLVKRFRDTLDQAVDGAPSAGPAPLGVHWCLAPASYPTQSLGPDGHPRRGGFLPPVPLPRRMWAGGELVLHHALRVGDIVRRMSRIDDVSLKHGRTGPLCFVSVRHELRVADALAVAEKQDIVYRGLETGGPSPSPAAPSEREPEPQWRKEIDADPVLLFRYSALTFNGHRIHYDRRYCIEEENYPGLVVHGPLQATLLLHFAAEIRGGTPPAKFAFRSAAPIFDGAGLSLNATQAEAGSSLRLWTAGESGRPAMTAQASW